MSGEKLQCTMHNKKNMKIENLIDFFDDTDDQFAPRKTCNIFFANGFFGVLGYK